MTDTNAMLSAIIAKAGTDPLETAFDHAKIEAINWHRFHPGRTVLNPDEAALFTTRCNMRFDPLFPLIEDEAVRILAPYAGDGARADAASRVESFRRSVASVVDGLAPLFMIEPGEHASLIDCAANALRLEFVYIFGDLAHVDSL